MQDVNHSAISSLAISSDCSPSSASVSFNVEGIVDHTQFLWEDVDEEYVGLKTNMNGSKIALSDK